MGVLLATIAAQAQSTVTSASELMAATPALRPGPTAGAALTATNAAAPNTTPVIRADLDDKHIIRAGDKLSFRIDEDKEEPRVMAVTDSGEIELPYNLGRFMAATKTCKTLAQEIKTAIEKDYYHQATVHLGLEAMNAVRGKVYVQGQVSKPGPVTVPADAPLRVSQALLLAGPPTQWAKLKDVRVIRTVGKETKVFVVNAEEFNNGRMENDIVLEPEDWVIVGERGIRFN